MKFFSLIPLSSFVIIFLVFLKIGLIFFGGGFIVIPVMHRELVTEKHWLSNQEFIDGTAISQLTPGPVAVLATFAGYCKAGLAGALVATFAIFLPGSLLMLFMSWGYQKLKNITVLQKVLNTLIPVIVGLLIAASWQIGKTTIVNWWEAAVFIISLIALIRFKINPAFLIIAAALLGLFTNW